MKKIKLLLGFALVAGSASAATILNDAQWAGFGRDAAYTIGAPGTFTGNDLTGDPRYHFDVTVEQALSNPDATTYGFVTITNSVAALGLSSIPDVWEAAFFNSSTNGAQEGALMAAYVSGTKGGASFTGFVVAMNPTLDLSYVIPVGAQKTLTWDMSTALEFGTYAEVDVTAVHAFGLAVIAGQSYGYPDSDPITIGLDVTSDAPVSLVKRWDFNVIDDTENFTANADVVGLTATNTISGPEGVLTSSDIIQSGDVLDPQCFYNELGETNLFIIPDGPWETMTVRMRQLTGNPSDPATVPAVFDINQVLFLVNTNVLDLGTDIISSTNEANGWVQAVLDISVIGRVPLRSIRIDPIAFDTQNFEIDYLQVSAQSWGNAYTDWVEKYLLTGDDALMESDPDEDTYNNLYEFAFNGNPTNDAVFGLVESSIVDDGGTSYVEYNYARRTDSDNIITYAFGQKGNLITDLTWFDLGDTAVVGTKPDGDYEVVTNRVDTTSDTELFHRVEVSGLE